MYKYTYAKTKTFYSVSIDHIAKKDILQCFNRYEKQN